jgi:hypothetical protein
MHCCRLVAYRYVECSFIDSAYRRRCAACIPYVVDVVEGEDIVAGERVAR